MSLDSEPKREYIELKLARGLIFHQEHILLVKNNLPDQGHYFLPGGKVDPRESVMTALVREFREELNWRIAVDQFLGCYEHGWQLMKKKSGVLLDIFEINFLFVVRRLDEPLSLQVPPSMEDKLSFHWEPLAALGSLNLLPSDLKEALPRLHKNPRTYWGTSLKPEVSGH